MDNETNFETLDEEQIRYALDLQKRLNFLEDIESSRGNFLNFVQHVWPDFRSLGSPGWMKNESRKTKPNFCS